MGSNSLASSPTLKRQRHLIVLGEHVLQVALGGDRLAARLLDDAVRLVLAELGAERERHGFGHDQPARLREIDAHALAVDFEALGDIDDGVERARGDERQRREGRPFRLPAAQRAFVLLDLRGHDGREQIGRDGRRRERRSSGGRIALVRHGGGAAAPGRRRLEGFGHVGLHQERNVAGDLAAGAGEDRKCRCDFGQPVAVAVPRRFRQRQIEQGGQPLGDVEPAIVERGERADRAAELQHQRLPPQPPQPLA